MNEPFLLPVVYKNKEQYFNAQLITSAYSYQIQVLIENDVAVNFERDDEACFRAIIASPDNTNANQIDTSLLQAIADKLEEILS